MTPKEAKRCIALLERYDRCELRREKAVHRAYRHQAPEPPIGRWRLRRTGARRRARPGMRLWKSCAAKQRRSERWPITPIAPSQRRFTA